jgi:hypothetical protein
MLGGKSAYFSNTLQKLQIDRINIRVLLSIKGYEQDQINIYLNAFDYFSNYPNDFDGATISKDLVDIPDLDLDAMLHDYHYLICKVSSSFRYKFKADWIYAKEQERKGKGQYSSFTRFIGLTIIGIFLVPIGYIRNGKMNQKNKNIISNNYEILISKSPR